MKRMVSKYDEFIGRLYIVAVRDQGAEVFIDRTNNFNRPVVYLENESGINEETYSNLLAAIKTCGYKLINKRKTKKKISITMGVGK